MVMLMGLALMVYRLAQKKLLDALEKEGVTAPDQKNKPTTKSTMSGVAKREEKDTVNLSRPLFSCEIEIKGGINGMESDVSCAYVCKSA